MITLDELNSHSSLLPAIGGGSIGKATNHLIKALLSNLDNINHNYHNNNN